MLTNLFSFFLISAIVLFFYYIFDNKYRWIILLISSIAIFLNLCGTGALLYMLFGIAVTYIGGLLISNEEQQRNKKIILGICLILLFSELLFLKQFINLSEYSAFFSKFLVLHSKIGNIQLATPIAISFYTLSIASYLIDIYRNVQIPEKNFFKLTLFTCYFPQMTIGPVTRYKKMRDEFFKEHPFDYIEIKKSFERVLWGLFKKLIIADRLAILINGIYSNYSETSGCLLVIATLLFGLQLYMDFSGGLDIVIGVSQAFRIKLPENFNNPYFSKSVEEYWRRWHITLHTWFRDYIFWPILFSNFARKLQNKLENIFSTEVAKVLPVYFAYAVIWLLIGIWHCTEPRFFMSTTLIPLVSIIISDIIGRISRNSKNLNFISSKLPIVYNFFCCITTYLLLSISWGFFIAPTVKDGFLVIERIFSYFNIQAVQNGDILKYGLDFKDIILIFICLIIVFIVSLLKENGYKIRDEFEKIPLLLQWLILYSLITVIVLFGIYGPKYNENDFIYLQF